MTQSQTLQSGLGRYVGGDHANKRTVDHQNRPIPEDKQQFEIGIAFDKTDPDLARWVQPVFAHAHNEFNGNAQAQAKILQAYNYFPAYGKQALDDKFSWKIWDGDTPNDKGQVGEHTRGKWVFFFKSSFPIKCSNSQNAEIPPTALKRGDWVDIAFTVAGNGLQGDNAGIYWNPQFVRLVYEGDPIAAGSSDPSTVFTAPPQYAMPAGARQVGQHAPPPAMAMPGGAPMPQMGNGGTGMPMGGVPSAMPMAGPAPTGLPSPTAYPSNVSVGATGFPGMPAPGTMPGPGAPLAPPQQNAPLPTGFPGNVPSHPTFAQGPQR